MNVTEEQSKIIFYNGKKSQLINSTAGSGKTSSIVNRLEYLLNEVGVPSDKILFLSFTNNAVDELRSRIKSDKAKDLKITTIHSFCSSVMGKLKKFRPIKTYEDFKNWYRFTQQPKAKGTKKYNDFVQNYMLLENTKENLSGEYSKFKLLKADGKKYRLPKMFKQYQNFLYQKKSIDFADVLIRTYQLTNTKEWKDLFNNKYDYIFVDEYQDTSALQMKILLALNAKQYCLVGDINQQIYQFTGTSDCQAVEDLLHDLHEVQTFNLTKNFRCPKNVVEYANNYTTLQAISNSHTNAVINLKFQTLHGIQNLVKTHKELVFLVRTNESIRNLETELLKRKIPISYQHIITPEDIDLYFKGRLNAKKELKYESMAGNFEDLYEMFDFIKHNINSKSKVMSIHKSKGLEFENVCIVNNFNDDVLYNNNIDFDKKEHEHYCVYNKESQNIHYVALTRTKGNLYFMIQE